MLKKQQNYDLKEYSTKLLLNYTHCWKYTRLQAIQDVDEFFLHNRFSEMYQINSEFTSAVNGCRQIESPNNW